MELQTGAHVEEGVDVIVLLSHVHLRPDEIEQDTCRHDGAGIHHRVVGLI